MTSWLIAPQFWDNTRQKQLRCIPNINCTFKNINVDKDCQGKTKKFHNCASLVIKKNQLLKREGKRLLMDLLKNKLFSKETLSEDFKINLFFE